MVLMRARSAVAPSFMPARTPSSLAAARTASRSTVSVMVSSLSWSVVKLAANAARESSKVPIRSASPLEIASEAMKVAASVARTARSSMFLFRATVDTKTS